MSKKIKVVLSGSGTLYSCHAGVLIGLADAGYEIEEICGVSGGSIIAAMIASGYKPNQDLVKLIKDTLPAKNNAIDISLFSLFQSWGLIKGDKIEKVIDKYVAKTFSDTKIPLYVVTTDVSRQEKRIFSSKTDPHMAVSKAVRGSMAIPFVFTPMEWGGEKYVDGGWVSNFPLDVFGEADNVIGVHFTSSAHTFTRINSVKDYIMTLLDTAISSNMDEDISDAKKAAQIVVSTKQGHLNFNITDKDVDDMIADGKAAAGRYLAALKK